MRALPTRPTLVCGSALLLIGVALIVFRASRDPADNSPTISDTAAHQLALRYRALEAREKRMDETVWAKEILAEDCGRTFEVLWDAINRSTNKLELIASFPVGEIVLAHWDTIVSLPHAIEVRAPSNGHRDGPGPTVRTPGDGDRPTSFRPPKVFSAGEWRGFVQNFIRAGWQLEQIEFRQVRFDTDDAGKPRQSHFFLSAHLANGRGENSPKLNPPTRAIVEGDLIVDWAEARASAGLQAVRRIDASRLTVKTRRGPPPFQLILNEAIPSPKDSLPIDPLILYDLDGDGLPEIILPAKNLLYRRRGPDRYEAEPLCRYPPGLVHTAVVADFDGDGVADLLCAITEGLVLFKGSPRGTFDEPGRRVWTAKPALKNAMGLTCGDVDGDGDLDVFLAQYEVPTLGQILRPHYYDANDGFPAYLLLNDGHGNFTDATESAGLASKRHRRTYSAAFADLDADGHLDLSVVSDFAGVELYHNDGHGHFTDVTRDWIREPHGFGMAQVLTDFNADGRLDLLMIGMPSPTVDRLDHLGLWRPDATEDHAMRARMTYGNRLLLARPTGGFEQTVGNDSLARSGWSWGASAFDFDNDGFPDVYIANGMQSGKSVREYEPEFWLHDVYIDESIDDATATAYLTAKYARTRGQGWSYGGYEKNRLYLNQGGRSFFEAGYLMGVALEQDSRCVVTDDLDGDGRVDLVVTTFEVWPEAKQTLRVYHNTLEDSGNWIGFHFREAPQQSPVGVRVTMQAGGRTAVREIVTGDSHRSQHATTVHFGLGALDHVDRVEFRWVDGRTRTLRAPAVNRYHLVNAD